MTTLQALPYSATISPRTILVTGAGSGLGQGICEYFGVRGHHVIATDLNPEAARQTAARVTEQGGQADSYALDVASDLAVDQLMHTLNGRPVDVLINNAGLQHVSRLEEFDLAKWDLITNVILRGTFLMTRALLPGMRANQFGRFIHIGSIHSLIASPYKSAYTATKHALLGFSKTVALETGGVDITSNTICPAYIRTPLVEKQIRDQAITRQISEEDVIQKVMLEPMPKKAFITIEEVAATAEFLISPFARNITGQHLAIDGGWTVQ